MDKIPEYLRETVYWVFSGKARRTKENKDVTSDDKVYLQEDFLQCLAVEMELGELVNLPSGVLLQEWIASHTVAFFEHINLIYGTISEFCTMSGCSEMIGPGKSSYLWTDERGKRSSKLPAPQYIDYVMTYMQKTLNDESIFPTKADKEFPTSFETYARKIYRLLFHVLAHIYHVHFKEIVILDLHKHLNCIYAHLILFNQQFNLIEDKELEILNDLSIALKLVPDNQEQMQTSTPEPPSLPSLNLSNSIDQYLDNNTNKDLNDLLNTHNHHLDLQSNLQSSNSFNQEPTTTQRKKHSRQHSYTASQTVSSPTNYNVIKRFISSFSPVNQQTTSSNTNHTGAINEENSNQQSKNPFSMRNTDELDAGKPNQDLLKDCDQENHEVNDKKIFLNNFNQQKDKSTDVLNQTVKTHKYQQSTPIFFSGSFFSSKQTKLTQDENDVQSNDKLAIKENTKLLNSDLNDEQYCKQGRTTSTNAIFLTQSNQSASPFASNLISNLNENLNENLNDDYSLDQATSMSYNQHDHSNLEQSNQMEISLKENSLDVEETDVKQLNNSTRKFGSLDIEVDDNDQFDSEDNLDNSLDNNHRTSSRRNVCAFVE